MLNTVRRKVLSIKRNFLRGNCTGNDMRVLDSLITNVQRIGHDEPDRYAELLESLRTLKTAITSSHQQASTIAVPVIRTGSRGRPSLDVTREQLRVLLREGFKAKAIARMLGCSTTYIYHKMRALGIRMMDRYTQIDDSQLEHHIRRLHEQFPKSGYEMMQGYLSAEGIHIQRHRVRSVLSGINPAAAAERWSCAVARRTYFVPFPNCLWHIDGHMRLVRWGIVTHGGIDGHSRVITYLRASLDNTALTVLASFVEATFQYGLPSRVRSDCGGENSLVALLLNLIYGDERRSHITGRSVHNQRIERLWRDVFSQVIQHFYHLFYTFEEEQILDPDNDIQRYSLQQVYLPVIQERLDFFRTAWNNHRLRTERNRTPNQLWMEGMVVNHQQDATAINNVFRQGPYSEDLEAMLGRYGVQLNQLEINQEALQRAVVIQQPQINLTNDQWQIIKNSLTTITDLKEKYLNCCRQISTLVH